MNPDDMNDDELQAALRGAADADIPGPICELLRAAADRIGELADFIIETGETDE